MIKYGQGGVGAFEEKGKTAGRHSPLPNDIKGIIGFEIASNIILY